MATQAFRESHQLHGLQSAHAAASLSTHRPDLALEQRLKPPKSEP